MQEALAARRREPQISLGALSHAITIGFVVAIVPFVCKSTAKMVARIGKPAPAFRGQAVLPGGDISEIKLEDYLNKGERCQRTAAIATAAITR